MLRYALRRAIWIPPALLLITIVLFGLVGPITNHDAPPSSEQYLPLFINLHPRDIRVLSERTVEDFATKTHNSQAEQRLVQLGSAALPFILPQFDALEPKLRGDVAMALQPIAIRMGLATTNAFASPEQAVAFWSRFWEERSNDYRPAVVRRAVKRLVTQGSPSRRTAIVELDTYALPGLMEALIPPQNPEDVPRIFRLLEVASHITGRPCCVQPDMAPADAARCVTLWKEWWLTTHSDFELLSGPDRVFAILTDTQYGKWVLQVLTLELGVGSDGVTVLERLRFRSPITVNTALLSLLLAYSFAFPLSLMGALKKNKAQDRLTTIILVILLAIPAPIIAVFAARMGSLWPLTFSTLIIVASLITSPARHQRLLAIAELSKDWSCFAHARGIHPMRILLVHVGNPVVALALTLAAIDFPLAMSVVCVTEYALGTEGLGSCLVRAVLERDVAFLMAFGLASTVLHTLLLFASDLLVERLDPRLGRIHRGERAWQ